MNINAYQALLLLSMQEDTNNSDMGGTYVGLFEDKNTNEKWHLITAPNEFITKLKWSHVIHFNNTSSFNGFTNCCNIKNIEEYPAIEYCLTFSFNGFNDYYLPSIYELRFINSKTLLIQNNFYWSSSEYDDSNCYTYTNLLISQKSKLEKAFIQPVRRIFLGVKK